MIILSLAMLAEIVTRYIFDTSLFGLEQFVGYAAVWLYFIGGLTRASCHPQMVFLPNLGVNRRVCLCDVASYVSAQMLAFIDLVQ